MEPARILKFATQETALVMSLASSVLGHHGVPVRVPATVLKRDHAQSQSTALARVTHVLEQQNKFSHAILALSKVTMTHLILLQMIVTKYSHQ